MLPNFLRIKVHKIFNSFMYILPPTRVNLATVSLDILKLYFHYGSERKDRLWRGRILRRVGIPL